jgi:alkylation response protein AidB-like acyl-CoA dehydrogenase
MAAFMSISDAKVLDEAAQAAADPTDQELAERFRPIFARIAEGAVARESARELPFGPIGWLRDAGFGAVRLPRKYGGLGASLPQFFRLLVELAEADSNVAHALRGHFAFLEERLNRREPHAIDFWFPKVAGGALIGFAMSERIEETGNATTLAPDEAGWLLDGLKFYSTGTLYADWIVASAVEGDDFVGVALAADAPGVARVDDWDGFGQRLTGSGTTKFERVAIPDEHVLHRHSPGQKREDSHYLAFLQLVLLATLAGIGRAAVRDTVAFVQGRTRGFGIPGKSSPRQDPLVQRVVGRVSSLSFAAETLVDGIAGTLERLHQAHLAGTAVPADYAEANVKTFQAQQLVIDLVLQATTMLFEVGGASATSDKLRLDRHWRNARTVASHNPAIYRERAIGDYLLNGTVPETRWTVLRQNPPGG